MNPGVPGLFEWLSAPDTNDPDEIVFGFRERDAKWPAMSSETVGAVNGYKVDEW